MPLTQAQIRAINYKKQAKERQQNQEIFSNEELEELRELSIIEYAKNYLNVGIIHESRLIVKFDTSTIDGNPNFDKFREAYGSTDLSSVRINIGRNTWSHYGSPEKAKGNIIAFVQYFEKVNFPTAIKKLRAARDNIPKVDIDKYLEYVSKNSKVPTKNEDCSAVRDFLINKRNIHPKIADKWINKGYVYADVNDPKWAVFPGTKINDQLFFATSVYTDKTVKEETDGHRREWYKKKDAMGSNKLLGIFHKECEKPKTLRVFEAPLDCAAWQSLALEKGFDFSNDAFVITCGVEPTNRTVIFNLGRYVADSVETVILMQDNDKAGIESMLAFENMTKTGIGEGIGESQADFIKNTFHKVQLRFETSVTKDWNDDQNRFVSGDVSILENIGRERTLSNEERSAERYEINVTKPTDIKDMMKNLKNFADEKNSSIEKKAINRTVEMVK